MRLPHCQIAAAQSIFNWTSACAVAHCIPGQLHHLSRNAWERPIREAVRPQAGCRDGAVAELPRHHIGITPVHTLQSRSCISLWCQMLG